MKVVNRRIATFHVYIGRGSPAGNPFSHIPYGTKAAFVVASREYSIRCFKAWAMNEPWVLDQFPRLRDQDWVEKRQAMLKFIASIPKDSVLGCYCYPLPCHGDVFDEIQRYLETTNDQTGDAQDPEAR